MTRTCFVLLALASAWLSSACGGAFQEARGAFDEARYADASVSFRSIDPRALDSSEQAQFDLYFGLTQFALGDLDQARPHLTRAMRALQRDPEAFDAAEQGRLLSAWHSMGRMPGQSLD